MRVDGAHKRLHQDTKYSYATEFDACTLDLVHEALGPVAFRLCALN